MFSYKVVIHFSLTRAELETITIMSKHHYDYKCRAASEVGGFIYGWHNSFDFMDVDGKPADKIEVRLGSDNLDLLCKICENVISLGDKRKDGDRIYRVISKMLRDAIAEWVARNPTLAL